MFYQPTLMILVPTYSYVNNDCDKQFQMNQLLKPFKSVKPMSTCPGRSAFEDVPSITLAIVSTSNIDILMVNHLRV